MKTKKQKTFFEKIGNLKGNHGKVQLSDKDRNDFVNAMDDAITKESKEMENFMWLIAGIGIGILGNFIVMLFYDWLKSLVKWQFVLMSVGFILLFIIICYLFIDKLLEHRKNIKRSIWSRKMWRRAKSVNVGPSMKAYEEDELKELKKDLAKNKDKKV